MKTTHELTLYHDLPAPQEYCALRVAAGLSPRTEQAAERGLPNTLYATLLRDADRLVAMGRVVGDGGCNFEIVDVAVHPDYQRLGLGTRIMAAISSYLERNAPASAYISLIADHYSPALYRKFGFEPVAPNSIGMARKR
ncbi:MAG: GNAT family N-acetyltransferase [Halioglobus sp.]